jgi:hypothetical protein
MKRIFGLAAAVALVLGATQVHGQSVLYNFSDGTADGWANAGFSGSPAATVANIGGQNYISIPVGGFQVGNVTSVSSTIPGFTAAMEAAAANPSGYDISYNWYVNTATWTGSPTYLQIGTFVNTGSGYYAQDYGSPNEVQLNGTQMASGQVFQGTVTINLAAVGYAMPPADTFFRLGLVENSNGTGAVDFTDISVAPVPEPASLALIGLGMAGLIMIRRRNS